jgi:phosphoenolpyruvate-protein kinase (PTS system EI component)
MTVIDDVVKFMKMTIQASMANCRKISFCGDIWSKKGLTSSYLGITAHFFSPIDLTIHHPTLAV